MPWSGICWMPWTNVGSGRSGDVEHRRRHVDDVVELVADLALGLDPSRPVDDRPVAGPAPVRGDLLGPLVGRVHRVRPADRVVVVRLGGPEVVDALGHELDRLEPERAVENDQLVEAAVRRAFGRGAVVADRSRRSACRRGSSSSSSASIRRPTWWSVCSRKPAYTSICRARTGLHLVGRLVPRGDLRRSRRQLRVVGDDAELLLPRERLLAERVPALVELALVLADHSGVTWCGACVAPGA